MSALPKLDDDGLIKVPKEIQDAAGLHPGDVVAFRVVGPGKVELTTLRPISLDELLAKYGPGEPISDWSAFRVGAEAEQGDEFLRRVREGDE